MYTRTFIHKVFFLVLIGANLIADIFQPSPSCYEPIKPFKPYSFTAQWEVDSYNNSISMNRIEIDSFRNCIQSFIDEQNMAIKKHLDAIDEATNKWNNFVAYQ
ncbi:MAG: hypothetical protein EOM50_06655 [Erysipelotrichia bacterium]|nr:hypothetical protein [Erysipelotrichia bacterium]